MVIPDWRRETGQQLERLRKIQALEFASVMITEALPWMQKLEDRMTAIGHRDQLRKIARDLEAEAPSSVGRVEAKE